MLWNFYWLISGAIHIALKKITSFILKKEGRTFMDNLFNKIYYNIGIESIASMSRRAGYKSSMLLISYVILN